MDESRIEIYDEAHSIDEERYITVGLAGEVLFVVYTERTSTYLDLPCCIPQSAEQEKEQSPLKLLNPNFAGCFFNEISGQNFYSAHIPHIPTIRLPESTQKSHRFLLFHQKTVTFLWWR